MSRNKNWAMCKDKTSSHREPVNMFSNVKRASVCVSFFVEKNILITNSKKTSMAWMLLCGLFLSASFFLNLFLYLFWDSKSMISYLVNSYLLFSLFSSVIAEMYFLA